MLFYHDGQEDGDPVAHEREEVFEDFEEVVPACDAAGELDDDDDDDPEPAGDGFEVAAEDLQVDGCGVGSRDVVLDRGQGEDDGAEAAEAAEVAVAGEEERAGGGGVGGLPGGGYGDAAGEADADDVDEDEGGGEAEPGHEEGEGFGGPVWVVDVEVGAGGRPADGDGVLEGEEGEAVGDNFTGGASDWSGGTEGGVEIRTSGADEDEENDKLGDTGPSGGVDVSCDSGKGEALGEENVCVNVPFVYVKDSHAK